MNSEEGPVGRMPPILSSHGRVLAFVIDHPTARRSEIAAALGLTGRSVGRLVGELERAGLLEVDRQQRRNRYSPGPAAPDLRSLRVFADQFDRADRAVTPPE
jgi:DNA-binding IclR family transcriptional regulator